MKIAAKYHVCRVALVAFLLAASQSLFGQTDSLKALRNGRSFFQTNCGACHSVHKEMTGPMLASITRKRSNTWLRAFIRDSQGVIVSGDDYALHLFRAYNHQVMPSFRQLSDTLIGQILYYIERESVSPSETLPDEPVNQIASPEILKGKELFSYQCANCHSISKEDYGPALGSVGKRLPTKWLIPFIRNSQAVIASGDAYANHVFNAFDRKVMVEMEFLTPEDVGSILHYIDFTAASSQHVAGVNGRNLQPQGSIASSVGSSAHYESGEQSFFKVLFIVMALIAGSIYGFLIARLFRYLNKEVSRRH
jgi:mono/diheme cytochrome c family protein